MIKFIKNLFKRKVKQSEPERTRLIRQMYRLVSKEKCLNLYGYVPFWFTCPGASFEYHKNGRHIILHCHPTIDDSDMNRYLRWATIMFSDGRNLLHGEDLIEEFYEEEY